jgi:peptide/nickel transport system permease protein
MTEFSGTKGKALPLKEIKGESQWVLVWRNFRRHKLAISGAVILLFLFVMAVFAPSFSPYDPDEMDIKYSRGVPQPPSRGHPFGTDEFGRDYMSRTIYGARISLSVGFVSVGISMVLGILVGALAGYFGGQVDSVLMRLVDVLLSLPSLLVIMMVNSYLEPSIFNTMLAIGLFSWMGVARLVRGQFLSIREEEFVLAARCMGVGPGRMIFRHLLPSSMAVITVAATIGIAAAILTESGLSFLGFGIQPPTSSWGSMLQSAQTFMRTAWWISFFPGLCIALAVLSFNFVGDGLRDSLDPKLRRR